MATNKVSSLVGTLETEVHIKASTKEFYNVFAGRPYLTSDATPRNVQGCDLLDGEWGTVGSIIVWNYVHDGKAKVAKEIIEALEPEKNLITFKVIDGDLLDEFKSFAITLQVTPKHKELGSIGQWKLEYEKISEEVAHPKTFLQLLVVVSKEVEKYLSSEQ